MSFTIEVGFPDDEWVPMPLADEDVAAWVEEVCAAWEIPDHLVADYRTELTDHAERFRRLDAWRGALWLPDVEAGFVATWSLDLGSWFEQSTVSVEEVEDVSRRRQRPSGLAEPTIERVSLPAGPAVRIREFDAVEDGAVDGTLAESVSHVVVPDGIRDDQGRQVVLWQRVTWSEVVHGDELAEVADTCAELLVVTPDA